MLGRGGAKREPLIANRLGVFGMNRTTVSAACRWVEDERDSRAIDDLLEQLEACIAGLYDAPRWEMPACRTSCAVLPASSTCAR